MCLANGRFPQKPWLLLLALFGFGTGIWGIYRLRVGTVRARLAAVTAERARIARELHDTLTQDLVAASRQLELAAEELPEPPTACGHLARSQALVASGLAAARRAVSTLRAPLPNEGGLPAALGRLAASMAEAETIEVQVEPEALRQQLSGAVQENLLGIAREALANAVRHAEAKHIRIELGQDNGKWRLRVVDNGRGFDLKRLPLRAGHFGLLGMRERARAIGGDLTVESAPGRWTVITATVPVRRGRP